MTTSRDYTEARLEELEGEIFRLRLEDEARLLAAVRDEHVSDEELGRVVRSIVLRADRARAARYAPVVDLETRRTPTDSRDG